MLWVKAVVPIPHGLEAVLIWAVQTGMVNRMEN